MKTKIFIFYIFALAFLLIGVAQAEKIANFQLAIFKEGASPDVLFVVTPDEIESYNWTRQSITLSAEASLLLLQSAGVEAQKFWPDYKYADEAGMLYSGKITGSKTVIKLNNHPFVVKLGDKVIYKGLILDKTSQTFIECPAMHIQFAPGKIVLNILPVQIAFVDYDPISEEGAELTPLSPVIGDWANRPAARQFRPVVRDAEIKRIMEKQGKLAFDPKAEKNIQKISAPAKPLPKKKIVKAEKKQPLSAPKRKPLGDEEFFAFCRLLSADKLKSYLFANLIEDNMVLPPDIKPAANLKINDYLMDRIGSEKSVSVKTNRATFITYWKAKSGEYFYRLSEAYDFPDNPIYDKDNLYGPFCAQYDIFALKKKASAADTVKIRKKSPVDILAEQLSKIGARWISGVDAEAIKLPEGADTAQIVSEIFKRSDYNQKGLIVNKILQKKEVDIEPLGWYTAVLADTKLGKKIVILRYNNRWGWWGRVYNAPKDTGDSVRRFL